MRTPLDILHDSRTRLHARYTRGPIASAAFDFLCFGLKQAWACLFGGLMLALLLATYWFYPADAALARYDFITLGALSIQIAMLVLKLETWEEARVIFFVSPRRDGDGDIQDPCRQLGLSGAERLAHRGCAALLWLYVCLRRELYRARLAAI
jgi:hypothetical protein